MADLHPQLAEFRARARRIDLARLGARWIWDLALLSGSLTVFGVALVLLTSRGDLAILAMASGLAGFVVARILVQLRAQAALSRRAGPGFQRRIARRILETAGPLADPPIVDGADPDAALRHEFFAATCLEHDLQAPSAATATRQSGALAQRYLDSVAERFEAVDMSMAVPALRWRERMIASVLLSATLAAGWFTPQSAAAFDDLLNARDTRPPAPPERIWSRLELSLAYPVHSQRASRRIPNPSGALRVLAGTEVTVEFWTRRTNPHARLLLAHGAGPDHEAPAPQVIELKRVEHGEAQAGQPETPAAPRSAGPPQTHWRGHFELKGAAQWSILLFEDLDDAPVAHSAPARFELELDEAPQVELERQRDAPVEASEMSELTVAFKARDDFGLRSAQLVYRREDGSEHRVEVPPGAADARRWSRRARLDLSTIPVGERGQLEYWIEVRDNDPGLGLTPLANPPGKVGRSARKSLNLRDLDKEHAQNVESLRQLRDALVDLLGARLMSREIFTPPRKILEELLTLDPGSPPLAALDPQTREIAIETRALSQLRAARSLHEASGSILAMLSGSIDQLAIDPKARERDLRQLAAMHARLLELYRSEDELHTRLPEGSDMRVGAARIAALLKQLGRHDRKEQTQLEDEIIRLDDLVDGELIRQLEALTARLEAGQQKLVELLEQLKAGDESVRSSIEQLEARLREDMQRYREARQALSKEVGDEFFNRDAFANLEAMMKRQGVLEALKNGDVDRALQQARETLNEMRSVNEAVQERAGEQGEDARLDPIEAARMKLLRELGRLRELQGDVNAGANDLHQRWRDSVAMQPADESKSEAARASARELLKAFDQINDAQLSRQGREGLEDARDATNKLLEKIEKIESEQAASTREAPSTPSPGALALWEAALEASEGLEASLSGLPADDPNRDTLESLDQRARALQQKLRTTLPKPAQSLDAETRQSAGTRAQEQRALEGQVQELLRSELWEGQPVPALEALEIAGKNMGQSVDALTKLETLDARGRGADAGKAIKRSIDALRQSTPPPQSSAQEDSSTEAERDRSLRDQVVEAMREGGQDAMDESVSRYYEELLK